MPLINAVVESLGELDVRPVDLVITDGDDTAFPKGGEIPYPEALEFLERVQPAYVFLVSDDPNRELAKRRAEAIGADGFQIPNRFPHWVKYNHFRRVVERTKEVGGVESAVVLGNRWLMDVATARIALTMAGIENSGYLVQRPDAFKETFDRIIAPVQFAGATLVKGFGADQYFRPRRP